LQGHHTKLDKTKRTEVPTVSSHGQTTVLCSTITIRLIIVKRRPKKYSLKLAMERRQWRCIPDRRRQAVSRTCQRHGHRALNVRWTVPPAWLSAQCRWHWVSMSDVWRRLSARYDGAVLWKQR